MGQLSVIRFSVIVEKCLTAEYCDWQEIKYSKESCGKLLYAQNHIGWLWESFLHRHTRVIVCSWGPRLAHSWAPHFHWLRSSPHKGPAEMKVHTYAYVCVVKNKLCHIYPRVCFPACTRSILRGQDIMVHSQKYSASD